MLRFKFHNRCVVFGTAGALLGAMASVCRGQVPPPPPTVQSSSLIAGSILPKSMNTGTIPAAAGTQAIVNDSFSGPIQAGNMTVGSAAVNVSASAAEGTTKLFSNISASASQASVAILTNVGATASDSVQITQLAGGQGMLAAEYFPTMISANGTITGQGSSWSGNLMLTVSIQDIAADGTPGGTYLLSASYMNGNTGSTVHDTPPAMIPVQLNDTLTLNLNEVLHASASAPVGGTASVAADFSHSTHLYLVPLTPQLAFTSASGHSYLPIAGDANVDGKVDFSDLVILARNYGQSGATWGQGDFDADGTVDFGDLVALARNYGATADSSQVAPALSSGAPGAFTSEIGGIDHAVPEPSCAMAGAGAGMLLYRRRR